MKRIIEKAAHYVDTYGVISRAHYIASESASKCNQILGIPVVVLSTIIGTTIFATVESNPSIELKIITGLIAIVAAVLSALQTTFKFSEHAEKHRSAGAKYAALKRTLDLFILQYESHENDQKEQALLEMKSIVNRVAELAEECPGIPDNTYLKAKKQLKNKDLK